MRSISITISPEHAVENLNTSIWFRHCQNIEGMHTHVFFRFYEVHNNGGLVSIIVFHELLDFFEFIDRVPFINSMITNIQKLVGSLCKYLCLLAFVLADSQLAFTVPSSEFRCDIGPGLRENIVSPEELVQFDILKLTLNRTTMCSNNEVNSNKISKPLKAVPDEAFKIPLRLCKIDSCFILIIILN